MLFVKKTRAMNNHTQAEKSIGTPKPTTKWEKNIVRILSKHSQRLTILYYSYHSSRNTPISIKANKRQYLSTYTNIHEPHNAGVPVLGGAHQRRPPAGVARVRRRAARQQRAARRLAAVLRRHVQRRQALRTLWVKLSLLYISNIWQVKNKTKKKQPPLNT